MATELPKIVHEVPEWEVPSASTKKPLSSRVSAFFTSKTPVLPLTKQEIPDESKGIRRTWSDKWLVNCGCMGRSRRTFFCSLAALVLLILALGLGLGLGLSHKLKKSAAQNLPLPTNGGVYTGELTYYDPGYPGFGACGYANTSTDAICAISHLVWDAASTSSNPNLNPLCGKMIRITRYDSSVGGNRSVDVEVVDRCVGCVATDLDLSLKMFTSLADESLGRVTGSWAWL